MSPKTWPADKCDFGLVLLKFQIKISKFQADSGIIIFQLIVTDWQKWTQNTTSSVSVLEHCWKRAVPNPNSRLCDVGDHWSILCFQILSDLLRNISTWYLKADIWPVMERKEQKQINSEKKKCFLSSFSLWRWGLQFRVDSTLKLDAEWIYNTNP